MTAGTTPSAAERVAAGVAWLDETRPDWWLVIGREGRAVLDVDSHFLCPLGLVWGAYDSAPGEARAYCQYCDLVHVRDGWARAHGFYAEYRPDNDGDNADALELTNAWRAVLAERLDEWERAERAMVEALLVS